MLALRQNSIYIIIIVLILNVQKTAYAQESSDGIELKRIIYKEQFQAGISFNTNGYSLNARRTWSPTAFTERGFDFNMAMVRHPKEVSDYNYYYIGGDTYVYGKLNSLYTVHVGFGESHVISKKRDIGSIEINYFYFGGISLGGVKPIYLEINTAPLGSENVETSTERYDPSKHNLYNIVGGKPFTKGFSEMKLYPGIYAKFGIDFDYKISNQKIGTIETGIVADYFFKEVPIMANTDNYNYFLAFYLSVNFGKKWN